MNSFPLSGSNARSSFLLAVLTSTLFPCASTLLCPPFRTSCTRDLTIGYLNVSYSEMIQALRSEYEDMPLSCQIDHGLCKNETTWSYEKGDIVWPLTVIGTTLAQRCPYAYTADQYATRDCIVNERGAAVWTAVDDAVCPLPPFSRKVEALDTSLVNVTVLEKDQCLAVMDSLDELVRIRYETPSYPVLHQDRDSLFRVCTRWIEDCYSNYDLHQLTINIWNVSDIMLNETIWNTWILDEYERFLLYLEWLFPRYLSSSSQSQNFLYIGDVLEATFWNYYSDGKLAHDFLERNGDRIAVSVTINSNSSSLHNVKLFLVRIVCDMVTVEVEHYSTEQLDDVDIYTGQLNETESYDSETTSTEGPLMPNQPKLIVVEPFKKIISSLVFLTFDESKESDEEIQIVFRHPQFLESYTSVWFCANEVRRREALDIISYSEAIRNSTKVLLKKWSTENCRLVSFEGDAVTCSCVGTQGYFAVLGPFQDDMGPPPIMPTLISDVSVFLGFPYIEELSIAGKVLRAVSLFCLSITILSYTMFSKTRKGTPTRILLNLCVSLIVLLVVLYVAEYEANTRMGCRILNIFRYYLVLVSLLWNAVEAHNMYKMLIKVFNAETSHFVLIAGIIAWGVPAVFVAIGLAVDLKAFDGTYFDCKFRCSLRQNTLIYGWILPMSLIIAHNLIIFSMVLVKVLLKTEPATSPNSKGSGRGHLSRLIGAFTMLALLGVPWVFSAFGVIDTGSSGLTLRYLEGMFNVIFVVCISLQGLFIFLFHCARSKDMRQHWKSVVKSRSTTLSSTLQDTITLTRAAPNDIGRGASHTSKDNGRGASHGSKDNTVL